MTTEAEWLAEVFESFAKDHKPDGWPAVQQHFLSEAASVLRLQAAEIERLKSEAELFAKHTGLTLAAKDTLLRQALEALVESRDDVLLCFEHDKQFAGNERYDKRIAYYKAQLAKHDAAIAAIKQHLGGCMSLLTDKEVHGLGPHPQIWRIE